MPAARATSCLTSAGRTTCSAAWRVRGGGAKTCRTPCRRAISVRIGAIRSSARSSSKEGGWMRILAFETSAKAASVALLEGDMLLGELYLNWGLTRTADAAGIGAASSGDHGADGKGHRCRRLRGGRSFTGVQIGVAAAKGFAWGRDIPCCGVSTLEAMAWQASEIFRHRVLRHGRAAFPRCITRASSPENRTLDTRFPPTAPFRSTRCGSHWKIAKTENNGLATAHSCAIIRSVRKSPAVVCAGA